MIQRSQLKLKSVVWGKVGCFPWWPGKIIRKLQHQLTTIYKVSFFEDNSYSYLHRQNIILFDQFDFEFNSSFPYDFKLEQAVRLAKAVNSRKKLAQKSSDDDIGTPGEALTCPLEHFEVVAACEVGEQEKTRLSQHVQQVVQQQISDPLNMQITNGNFLELIEFSHTIKRDSYCYSKRKQLMLFRYNLQQFLLQKYNLNRCLSQNKLSNCSTPQNHAQPKLTLKIHRKRLMKLSGAQIHVRATRRLQKQILKKGGSLAYSKAVSRELYSLLKRQEQILSKKFELEYIAVLKEINRNQSQNIEETVQNCINKLRTAWSQQII